MAKTPIETVIQHLKRAEGSDAILTPLIESFMRKPVDIDDKADRVYLQKLIEARSRPRKKSVYSPSQLGSCLRHTFFRKTRAIKPRPVERIEASGYFLDGNFRHFKWQFVLWKMHRKGIIELVEVPIEASPARGAEVFVSNEGGDYAGTIDNLIYIPSIDEVVTVDWKGMNGNSFANHINKDEPQENYVVQSVGYAKIANADSNLPLPKRIGRALVIGENKNGPVNNRRMPSPVALNEWQLLVSDHSFKVDQRIKKLRAYERRMETPPPACTSTRSMNFLACPFAWYCLDEVRKIEAERRSEKQGEQKPVFNKEKRNGNERVTKAKTKN